MYDISAGVRSTRSEDGAIVLYIEHLRLFRLNSAGALILESLEKGCAEAEIAQEVARQYNISEQAASADIREFLHSLEAHKLIRVRRGEGIS